MLAVGRARRALGHVDQAGPAEQQRGPADGRADRLGVPVRVPQEPPGQQRREHGYHPGERAERVDRRGMDGPPGRVAHPAPQAGPEHDGHAQGEQPHTVPAVMRIQVARAAADGPGREPDRAGRHHPGRRDRAAGPSDQDHDRIVGRPALGRAALRRTALRRTRLPGRPLAVLFLLTRTRLGVPPRLAARPAGRPGRRGSAGRGPRAGAGARAAASAGWASLLVGSLGLEGSPGLPAARAARSVTGTGHHSHKRSENLRSAPSTPAACLAYGAIRSGGGCRSSPRS